VPGPLSGIRVVDLTVMASGPFATSLLGDQGADVLKVEPPGTGDLMRRIGNARGGVSAVFANLNRSKRSLVLNLAEARGVEILDRLVATADVFVQNFRPGVAERMGIGARRLRALRPELVYVSISGFGEAGPDASRRVYDSVMQAYAGFAAHQADPDTGEPEFIHNIVCDKSTAWATAQAITAALFARERGAGGQHLRISMLHASIAFLWPDGMQNHTWLDAPAPGDRADPMSRGSLPAIRRTADGHVAITTVGDAEFRGLCRALGRPELQHDPRFAEAGSRARNAGLLHAIVAPLARALSTADLVARLEAEDVPHAVVTPLERLHEHPQVRANSLLREDVHPLFGRVRQPAPLGDFEATPLEVRRLAPGLGEHSDEILAEIGIGPEVVRELRAAGIVA
jgi:crotonobetainyl-CoA:carnitine CoA-transferase CaiB-like acyl-CoA transferase